MPTYLDHEKKDSVQTTDATVTTCGSYTLPDKTVALVHAFVVSRTSGGVSAGYERVGLFKREGGGAALVGAVATPFTAEEVAGWDCTLDVSGNDIRCRVSGAAATTIDWMSRLRVILLTP